MGENGEVKQAVHKGATTSAYRVIVKENFLLLKYS